MRALRLLPVAVALFATSRASAAQKVMLCVADTAIGPDLQTKLTATGAFASVEWVNCAATTPSLTTMRTYDAILVTSNGGFLNRATLGDNLADYVDGGGYVVQTQFALFASAEVLGRWATDNYWCIQPATYSTSYSSLKSTPNEATSLLVSGVTAFSAQYRSTGALNAARGATSVWDYNDGRPAICRMTIGGKPRVDLNFLPSSSGVYTGDGITLVKNALLFGAGPQLAATPSPVTFTTPSGSIDATLTLKSAGGQDLTITSASISTNPTEFSIVSPPTFPLTLAPPASTTLTLRFTPSATGVRTGAITIASNDAASPLTIALRGSSGPPAITVDTTTVAFPATDVGSVSAASTIAISNTGFSALAVSSIALSGANPGDFSLTAPALPANLAPGASISVPTRFAPSAVGVRTATINIASNDPSSPTKTVSVSGTGRAVDAGVDAAPDAPLDTAVDAADSTTPDTADTSVADTLVPDTTDAADSTVADTSVADTLVADTNVEDTSVEDTTVTVDSAADTSVAVDAPGEDASLPTASPAADDGCGCSAVGRRGDRWAGLALLAVLLGSRRRRREER